MKRMALAVVVGFLVAFAGTIALSGCGAEWAACETCKPGEQAAQADDGTDIPIVINVTVNNPPPTTTPCTTCSNPPVDAGTSPVVDAGCPTPPVCRRVCTCTETRYVCKNGKDTNKKSDCGGKCGGVKKEYKKCTKEVTQCS